eukprot:scaffold2860_cov106-Isochrysis_galbana.AAC.8
MVSEAPASISALAACWQLPAQAASRGVNIWPSCAFRLAPWLKSTFMQSTASSSAARCRGVCSPCIQSSFVHRPGQHTAVPASRRVQPAPDTARAVLAHRARLVDISLLLDQLLHGCGVARTYRLEEIRRRWRPSPPLPPARLRRRAMVKSSLRRRAKASAKETPGLLSIGALTVDEGVAPMHVEQEASASTRKGRAAKRGVVKAVRKVKRKLAKRKVAGINHRHQRKNVNRKKK